MKSTVTYYTCDCCGIKVSDKEIDGKNSWFACNITGNVTRPCSGIVHLCPSCKDNLISCILDAYEAGEITL